MLPLAHLGGSAFEPLQLAGLTALGAAYGIRAARLAAAGRGVPGWRVACFYAGLLVLVVAFVSPIAHLAEELVTGHMIQHLLVVDIAALLVVLGLTGPILQPLLAIRALRWLRVLAHPVAAFGLWAVLLYAWHIPALYEGAAFDSEALHALQHISFFTAGLSIWLALIGPLPEPAWFGTGARVIYVSAVRLAGGVLANVMMWSGTLLYPRYSEAGGGFEISPLADQGTAGVVMMVESSVLFLATFAWLILRWARQDGERQALLDLAAARGVELGPERAERAVRSGTGERLRERIEGTR